MLSDLSVERLGTCHPDLQKLVLAVSAKFHIAVLCGHRGQREQDEAFHDGKSKLAWPQSKHNLLPAMAVDLAPLTPSDAVDWRDLKAFDELAVVVQATANELCIKILWGGAWKMRDFVHWQLV